MKNKIVSYKTKKISKNDTNYNQQQALIEFEELKKIALNCFDKNGNPNIVAALRAAENKARIAGLYSQNNLEIGTVVKMGEITIDGKQLKLRTGEDFIE